jgi:hypothetical protein
MAQRASCCRSDGKDRDAVGAINFPRSLCGWLVGLVSELHSLTTSCLALVSFSYKLCIKLTSWVNKDKERSNHARITRLTAACESICYCSRLIRMVESKLLMAI